MSMKPTRLRRIVMPLAVLSAAAAAASSMYFLAGRSQEQDQEGQEKKNPYSSLLSSSTVVPSLYRIANLGSTAAVIVYEYKTSNIKKNDDGLAKLHKTLQDLQDDLDVQVVRRYDKNNSDKEVEHWIELAKQTRKRIEENTELIGLEQMKVSDNEASLSSLHRKCAKKLANMCMQNKGLYIKLGQHISMMDHVIPLEYQEELAKLLSKNPTSPIESVRNIVKEDLGKYPEELFAKFEEVPIASASLAQVHIAYDKNGVKYAVKVQHKGLRENSASDMKAVTFIVNTLSDWFPEFDYKWLTKEMNRNLPKELDFNAERENIYKFRRLMKDLIDSQDIAVPTVLANCCSSRVLTMSFEEGDFVSNIKSIEEKNISKKQLSSLISTVFCEQVFRHGFVHCDPHEANLLVRQHPNKSKGHPQLVVLDHGLYRELDDEFRRNYCRLWRALVCSDEAGIKKYAQKMNSGEFFALLGAILTMKPWDEIVGKDITRLKAKSTKGDAVMMSIYAEKYFKQINHVLGKVPSDMLLLLKTNDCLRHLDRLLKNPINTAAVVAEVTSSVLLREELADSTSYSDYVNACYNYYSVRSRLLPLTIIDWYLYFKSFVVSSPLPLPAAPTPQNKSGEFKSFIISDDDAAKV